MKHRKNLKNPVHLLAILSACWLSASLSLRGQERDYETHLSRKGMLEIVARPAPFDFMRGHLSSLPSYSDEKPQNFFQVDLRQYDLTGLDLSDRAADLRHAVFDTRTRWPGKLAGFDPAKTMERGKDPGLRVRQVHAMGITGKAIGIGFIDTSLLVDHVEYRDRLRLYEEIHSPYLKAQMHGPAVVSIAAGKTVGVAPEADVYFIGELHGTITRNGGAFGFEWDFTWLAKSMDRLLEVNASLPRERRIRVISASVGWTRGNKGYDEVVAAVERARKEGIFVVSTSLDQTYSFIFHGLGRDPLADPNTSASFRPGTWWSEKFWSGAERFAPGQRLLVPMDSRCVASPRGPEDYVFYADGGWSWSVPWIAGLYALACQARPDITPERFWSEALATGQTIRVRKDATEAELGTIADPIALIRKLRGES